MNIKAVSCTHRLLRLGLVVTLCFLAAPGVHAGPALSGAGLTLEMNVVRYHQSGYDFYPNLTTNTTSSEFSFGDYGIASSGSPGSGSSGLYHFDTNGFNQIGGGTWGYGDFDSMMFQLTNGTWSLFVTNATTTNVYHFTVTANIDSNSLPPVTITFPATGAVNVINQPTFIWHGPTNYSDLVVYEYNNSSYLPVTQTNWPSPGVLYQGKNDFTAHYDSNSLTAVVSSVPIDNASHSISGWVSKAHLQDYATSEFSVGTVDPSGTSHTLVAHYPFDATSGPVLDAAVDTSGNGYDMSFGSGFGSQGGVNLTSDSAAGVGAVHFHNGDGNSAGYLGWNNPTPSALLSTLAGSFSISCWIKTTQGFAWDDAPAYYGAGIISADNFGLANDLIPIALTGSKIGFNTGGDSVDVTQNSTASVNDGNYHHVVVTRNQSTGQKIIYIDGVLDSFSSGTTNPLNAPQKLTIGALANAGNPDPNDGSYYNGFDGEVDDLQIYSGVLSAADAATLYASPGSTVANGGGSLVGGHRNVAHYAFDDSGNLGHDSSGNGNDMSGPIVWGPTYQFNTDAEAGGGAVQFFATSALYADGQTLTNLNAVLAGSFTMSAWVKTTVSNGADDNNAFLGATIFWAYNDQGNTNDTIPLSITGSKAAFTTRDHLGNDNTLHSSTSVNDGNYHLITVTRNQASGEKRIYVDGNFETSEIGTTDPLNGNNYNLTIGGYAYCTDGNCTNFYAYNGLLDDAQIYTGVLSDAEVASLYANPGTTVPDVAGGSGGPVVHYDFDEGTVLAADVSGNNNNIVHAGNFGGSGPSTSSDVVAGSGSVSFDGGSYLTASSNLLATLASDFTVSLWLKTSQSFGSQNDYAWAGAGIIAADSPNSGAKDLIPVALTGGQVAFNVGDGSFDDTLNSSATVNDNVWHHVVVTRSQSTGQRQIYIDGTFDSSKGGTTELLNSPVLLTIGAKSDASDPDPASPDFNGSNGYEGLLDDLQIYPRVLDSSEVAFLYINPGAVLGGGSISNSAPDFNTALNTVGLTWTTSGNAGWFIESTKTHDGVLAAQSGVLTNGQISTLQTTVTGPGTLSFWWTTLFNYLDYYINGGINAQFSIDGNDSDDIYGYGGYWTQDKDVVIPPGQHTLTWTAYGGNSLTDAGFLDEVVFTNAVAPQITSGPYNSNVQTGSNIVLTVQLYANPTAVIEWLTNGVAIHGATNSTLVISNAQLSDAKSYQVIASNYLGVASASAFVSVYQPTDLKPLSLTAPPLVSSTTLVPLVWTATNTGPATLSGYYDTVYIETNGTIVSAISYYIGYFGLKVLPATSYTFTNLIRFPSVPAGNYTLVLGVDSFNSIIETDETNNTLPGIPVTVINQDLQPGNLQISSATNLGQSVIQFTYNTTNNGPGILDGANYYDELFLSTNSVLDSTATYIQQINQAPSLGVGQHFTSTNYATMPVIPSGDYYLILHVDHFGPQPQGYIWETSETNNYAVRTVHIIEPDLVPTNIIAPAFVSSRQPVQLGWNIQNQGDGIATNLTYYSFEWADGLYLSTNQQVNGGSILLGNYYISDFNGGSYYSGNDFFWNTPLGPGQVMTNLQNVIIPNVPAGNYYLVLSADVLNSIREINETNNIFTKLITLGTLDLMPTAFTAPPAANARSTISITWSVTNQGTGTVYPAWVDRIFISTSAVLGSGATLLGEFQQTNGLTAGAKYSVTNSITLNGVGAGNYYLLLYTDAATNVMEVNHSNNIVARPLTINSPDLVATALTVGTNFSSQQPFSAVYTVSNASPVTAYAGWSDRLFLSPDGILETNNLPLGDVVPINDLAPNTSYSQLVNSSIPAVPAGDYFVLLQANANQFFVENNTQNNLLAKPVHISNPDLVLTNFAAPSIIVLTQYNQGFEADWSVLNQGAGDAYAGWADYLYVSPTNVFDTNAVYIGSAGQSTVLGSGQSYLSFANARLPDGIQGNYYLLLRANDSRSLYESTYTNNLVVKPVHLVVPAVPVLSVVSVDSPGDAWSGQQIYVTWTLTNSGTAAVSGTFYDVVYLCSSAAGVSPQVYGEFQFSGQILPGQSIVRQQRISLPISLQGTFWVALQTDYNRDIFEFTYRTKEFLVASHPMVVHLTPTPNLVLTSVSAPTNMFSGGEGTVSWVETNSGTGPTSAPFWDDAVYLCDTTNFYTANYRVYLGAPNNVAYLNPGDSYASSANVTLPRGITGTFYFIVWADYYNQVFEGTNENDNTLTTAPVFVAPSAVPDLQVTTVQPPHDAFSGQAVSLKYAVTNFGLGQTQPSEVQWHDRVYISTNVTLDSSATYLGDIVHNGGLTPQAGYQTTSSLTLPVGISGDWYFIVSADIFNEVYEAAFEDNNDKIAAYVTHIALTPPPDLVTTITQSPTNVLASHVLSVTYMVFNNGTTITPNSGWNDNLYLWTNPVFDAVHATYMGTFQHYGALLPGAGYTNTFSVVLPADMAGTNYIFVRSDAYSAVFELNKTNNLASATNPVVITFRPSDLAVTSLTAPATCNAGASILVNWAVTNLGTGDTAVSVWYDRLILSQNILLGAPSDVQLAQVQHIGLLGTNGAYAITNQLAQVPSYVAAGNYQLFLVADAGNNVPVETNWNNNVYGPVPISITAHSPDLRVASAMAPASAVSGSTVTVNWTEVNAGDLPANASYWYDVVYLSPDGLVGPEALYMGAQPNVRSLMSGEFYTNSLAVGLPINIQSNYYFVVVADGFNFIPEAGAENNNSYVVNPPVFITPAPVPDLAVTSVITPANAFEGQNFHLSWVVKNVGSTNANSSWYDVAYLSSDQILDPALDTYLGYSYQTHNLAPGQSYTNSADFPIPQGLAGPFYVFVTTDPGHYINERGQLTNNTAYNPQAMQVQLLPPVDLVAGQITIPVNAVPGQNMTVSYTVQNQGSNTALGSWQDSLFISADTNWDVGDKLFASVIHTGDVPPGGSYTNVVTAPLPGVLPGDYHVIIRSDILNHLTEADKSNNIAASLNSAAMDVQRLALGTPAGNTLGTGQSAFYKFDATNGQTIRLQFFSTALLSDNELFLKFGQMPDSGNFDAAANAPFTANPEIYFTATNTGTYYLLVKCNYAATPTSFTVLAQVLPFTVTEIQPSLAGDAGSTTFLVRGALFDDLTQFQLSYDDTNSTTGTNTISARNVMVQDSSTAYVTFDFPGASDGYWNIQAIDGQTNVITATLTNAVMVIPDAGPEVDVSIDGPLAVREPSMGYSIHSCLVDYGNSGYSDSDVPLILVDGVNTTVGTTLTTLGTQTIELLGRSLVGPANVLRPQTYATKVLYFRGGDTELVARSITADSTVPLTDMDWTNIEASVRPAGVPNATWLAFWSNIRPRMGTTWGDYVQFLNRIAANLPAEQREVSAIIGSIFTNQPNFTASSQVAGTLYDSDGTPLAGVPVGLYQFQDGQQEQAASATTDGSGNFFMPYVAPGTYEFARLNSGMFDMDRDGQADPQPPTLTINNKDITGLAIYCYHPQIPTNQFNDISAKMAVDSAGVLHAVWERDGKLWHARYAGGQWVSPQPLSSMGVGSYDFIASSNLVDNASPGLMVVWTSGSGNDSELYYAVATQSGSTDTWSAPVQLTTDGVQDSAPALVPTTQGPVLIVDLKQYISLQDDTDLYGYLVSVRSSAFAPLAQLSLSPNVTPQDFQAGCNFGPAVIYEGLVGPYESSFKIKGGFSIGSSGCAKTVEANVSGVFDISKPGDFGVTATYGGFGSAAYKVDPTSCSYVFDNAAVGSTITVKLTYKNALLECLATGFGPPGKAAEISFVRFQQFSEAWGYPVRVGDEESFTVSLKAAGHYKHGPAPFAPGGFRLPETSSGVLSVEVRVSLLASIADKSDMMLRMGGPPPPPDVGVLGGSGGSVGVNISGALGLECDVWPTFKLNSTKAELSGILEIGKYSFGYKYTGVSPSPSVASIHPNGGNNPSPFDLPPDVTFSTDPAQVIGTTNVYGTNALFADLYRDGAPSLARDANGQPFMAWFKDVDPYSSDTGSRVMVANFDGTNWLAPSVITNSVGFNGFVNAALDPWGRPFVVWVHSDTSSLTTNSTYYDVLGTRTNADLYYSVFDGSAWSDPEPVVHTAGTDNSLSVSRDANGNLIAVWLSQSYGLPDLLLTSIWDGKGWSPAVTLASGTLSSPCVQAVGGNDVVLWTEILGAEQNLPITRIYQSTCSSGVWSAPAIFSPVMPASSATLVAAKAAVPRVSDCNFTFANDQIPKTCCPCQANPNPANSSGKNVACGVAQKGYDYNDCRPLFVYKACQVRPSDPNNIVGPEGYGPQRWVPAGAPLNYTIQFENDPGLASAPAKRVSITLPLDANFDPRTFRLGDFGFGGLIFNIPPDSAFYQTRLDLSATKGYYVDLIAGVDIANHQAFWTLTTIDPATGDVPQNALIGFLPPDRTPPEGEGFVSCAITPVAGVANGSPVAAKATIVFDNQPPMDTPSALNTLQTGQPASYVLPLPAVTLNPTFDVAWQGVTTSGGSGVSSYDIYASENGGGYYPWLQGTTLGQAPFVGQLGGTYAFYSLAHDNVGNVQATPTNADAVTFVSSNLPPVMAVITNLVVPPDSSIFLKIKATDPNGDTLAYSLTAAPTGATINATNGVFRWHPTRAYAETTNLVTVAVMDDGVPPLGTNRTFAIIVQDFLELSLGETNLEGGQTASIPVSLASNDGATNLLFAVQVPENVLTNWAVAATAPQIGAATLHDNVTNLLVTLNANPGQSLQGTQQVSTLTFSAVTNQVSGFVTLPITSVSAIKPGGAGYANYVTHAGTVIVVQNEPLIRASLGTNQSRSLQLYGRLGTGYQLMFNTNLGVPAGWQTLLNYTQTNGVITLPLDASNPVIFYQLRKP
jgi:subtilase family serine protease